jgi:hypothetical protein
MPSATALLALLTSEPVATSDLYDRVGYPALVGLGLVPYPAFRAQLERLEAAGLVVSEPGEDGATRWRRAEADRGT